MILPKVEDCSQAEIMPGFRLCKREEQGKLSCMTVFLFGVFLCFLLFDRNVAYASLGFASLAGLFAELVELNFGRTRIFARSEKTLEGSLAFLSAAVTIAFLFWSGGLLPLPTALVGALAALIPAAIPSRNAKEITIPLISGVVMSLL
jgi:dolichol kinase